MSETFNEYIIKLNELKNNAVSNSFIDNTVEKFKLQDEINNETVTNLKNVHKRINVVFKKIGPKSALDVLNHFGIE